MSFIPRLTYQKYHRNLRILKKEMGEEWVEKQLAKLRFEGEPPYDEDRWSVWNFLDREASLAFQERKLKEERGEDSHRQ